MRRLSLIRAAAVLGLSCLFLQGDWAEAQESCPRASSAQGVAVRCEVGGPYEVEVGEEFDIWWNSLYAEEVSSLGWQGPVEPKNGAEPLDLEGSWQGLKLSKPGIATVQLEAKNGGTEAYCDHVVVAEDNQPPELTIFSPADYGHTTSQLAQLAVIVTDNDRVRSADGVGYSVNGGPIKYIPLGTCIWGVVCFADVQIDPGPNLIDVFVEDPSGNVTHGTVNVYSDSGTGGLSCFINGPDEVQPDEVFTLKWFTHGGSIISMTSTWLNDGTFDPIRYVDPDNGSIKTLPTEGNLPNPGNWKDLIKPAGDKPSFVTLKAQGPKGEAYCSAKITHTDGPSCYLNGPTRVQVGREFNVQWKSQGAMAWKSEGWTGPFKEGASPPLDPYDLPKANGGWWNVILKDPGKASVNVQVEDADGKRDRCSYSVVAVDTEAPALTIFSPANYGHTTSQLAQLFFIALDNYKLHPTEAIRYQVNGGAMKSIDPKTCYLGAACFKDVNIKPGPNLIEVFIKDVSGNTTTGSVNVYSDSGTGGLSCFINGPEEVQPDTPFKLKWYAHGGSVTSLTATWLDREPFDLMRYVDPDSGQIKTLKKDHNLPNPAAWTDLIKPTGDKPSFVTLKAMGPKGEAYCSAKIEHTDGLRCQINGSQRVNVNADFNVSWVTEGATVWKSLGWKGDFAKAPPMDPYTLPQANGTWWKLRKDEPGISSVRLEVKNAAGKRSTCDYSVVAADLTPPTPIFVSPANNTTTNQSVMDLLVAATDNWGLGSDASDFQYRVGGAGPWTPVDRSKCGYACPISVLLEAGNNLIELQATDKANRVATAQLTINFQPVRGCSYPGCYKRGPVDFHPIQPCRAYAAGASRNAIQSGPKLQMNQTRGIRVAGHCGIPWDAVAVSVNMTAVTPTVTGRLTAYPTDAPSVPPSQLRFEAGTTQTNGSAWVNLAADKTGYLNVKMRNGPSGGQMDFVLDVTGYFK